MGEIGTGFGYKGGKGGGGGGGVIERNIISDVTLGAIEPGDQVNQGLSLTEFAELMLSKTFNPTFTSLSFSGSTGAKEVGTTTANISTTYINALIKGDVVGGVWNVNATQGRRSGIVNKVWIDGFDNGLIFTRTINSMTVLGTNSIAIQADYDQGDQPLNSKGAPYLSPLPAGSISNSVTWTGFYYRTAIAGNTQPTAANIRNNFDERRSNGGVLNLETGTTAKRFDVFVPQGSVLVSANDEGNLNLDITADFVLQPDFAGLDANGDAVMYKHYLKVIDNPYSISSNLKIIVS